MEEWKECKLEDICDVRDGTHDTPKQTTDGKYLVTSKHIKGGRIDLSSAYKISLEDFDFINRRSKVDQWDILISMIGTVGEICLISEQPDFAIKNVGLIKTENEDLAKYLYYYLKSPEAQNNISARLKGTTQQYLSLGEIRQFPIKLPPLPTQQKIAAILSSLDDKIELNNKINTNLEQQAGALFKNWFVDFEPFGGKMPEGWKVGKLSELITVKYGKDHKKIDDGNIPVYGSGGIMRYVEKSLYDKESVLIPRKGSLNNVFYINEPFWSVDTMFYTEMKKENIAKFVYFFVKGKDLNAMNAGSAVPSMTTEILNALEVIIPSDEYLVKFETIVSPMFKQIKQCIMENKNLSIIRDTLLPKLMNGEIDI